ncbi:MAG TPA: hypothetical protein PKY96_18830, partial [Flavobacteriales bacterium]|nr:hypothetical protein [Flavobacteriales bacterium]
KTYTTWTPWPPERDALLRAHYATMEWPDLQRLLKATRRAIKSRARVLELKRPRRAHSWSAEQLAYLQAHFATESAVDMAKRWGVKPHVVYGL